MTFSAVNWNEIPDPIDKQTLDRLTANFWLPEKVPVSNDLPSWGRMTEEEREATDQIFVGLTMLDTLQSEVGAVALHADAETSHEKGVFANIIFMEEIHAKSYSTIFSTLRSSEEIREIFRWSETQPHLQRKAQIMLDFYQTGGQFSDENTRKCMKKAASVMLESFLFYSGFYLPLKFSSQGKITNTADIIRLIMQDEGVHGYYIGYKFQKSREKLDQLNREKLDIAVYRLLDELHANELQFAELVYDKLGWTGHVKSYLRYNANKAMMNLGYPAYFPEHLATPEPAILAQMAIDGGENHDFFSGSGSSYVIGKAEETLDEDWD